MANPNKNKSPNKASTSTIAKKYSKSTPRPKIRGGNIVDSYQTKVEEIIVHVFTRSDKPYASFVSPMKKTLEADILGYLPLGTFTSGSPGETTLNWMTIKP